ncbi:hypothetical protein C8A01DRAFT_33766 [Parachaetomium inaequale]|uniref:Uncharacterized protein n=1 Tax=Parachaetomium inaequale TaxID=2588326 RepID=A0AAN6PJP3_9PEZI|nr:hypothetical protein C8A01DRAFT_33766 [Parachaetomium inaequale]
MAPYGLPQSCTTTDWEEADGHRYVDIPTVDNDTDTDLEANRASAAEPRPRTSTHCKDYLYCKWLAVAERCYRIQSKTLHIPDKYGWISPGPPRRQLFEATMLFYAVAGSLLIALANAVDTVAVVRRRGASEAALLELLLLLLREGTKEVQNPGIKAAASYRDLNLNDNNNNTNNNNNNNNNNNDDDDDDEGNHISDKGAYTDLEALMEEPGETNDAKGPSYNRDLGHAARECYRVQSEVLGIPDRFGFISPGPPALQVAEYNSFLAVAVAVWITVGATIPAFITAEHKSKACPQHLAENDRAAMFLVPRSLG